MNRKIAIALIAAAAAAGNAFAESPTIVEDSFVSAKSRAEVQAELAAYKQAGVNVWSIQYNPLRSLRGSKTRAEVVGEYISSRDRVAAMTGEDSGSAYLARRVADLSPTLAGQPRTAY